MSVRAPAISLLVPAFDAEATLAAALESVRRQTDPDWECVIVDDGSTDATVAVAERFAGGDPRFRVFRRPHGGIVPALGDALAAARGRFLARMDADDLMHRTRLARQRQALEDDGALAAVGCHVRLFPRATLGPGRRAYEAWINGIVSPAQVAADAFVECPVVHPTLFARREAVETVGAWQDHGWPEDYDLFLRMHLAGMRIAVVPARLLAWRDRPERLSRTSQVYAVERFTAAKAHHLARCFLAEHGHYALIGFGNTGKLLRAALAKHGKRLAAIVDLDPRRVGNVIDGVRVVDPGVAELPPGVPVIASVAKAGPREEVRRWLRARGLVETRDFVCAA